MGNNSESVLLLIDGDEVAWKAASSADSNDDGITPKENTCIDVIENLHTKLLIELEEKEGIVATDYVYFVGGRNNFRKIINTLYKSNRKSKLIPEMLRYSKDYLKEHFGAFTCHGVEGDDGIAATWKYWTDFPLFDKVIICSQDKDFQQLPEAWIFNTHYMKYEMRDRLTEEGAKRFFAKQMLMGDRQDGVEGLKGIGDKKSDKILQEAESEGNYFDVVSLAYFDKIENISEASVSLYVNEKMLRLVTEGIEIPKETQKI